MLLDGFNDFVTVMGIDPGIKDCGVAIVHIYADHEVVYKTASITVKANGEWLVDIWSIINEHIPVVVGIEREFIGVNPRDGILLARNIGMIIHELELFSQVQVSPQDNNFLLTGRKQKVTDKNKKEGAKLHWNCTINQHEASAVATAINGYKKFKEELEKYGR